MRLIAFAAVFVTAFAAPTGLRGSLTPKPLGWSAPGHEITGAIAMAFLTTSASNRVNSILQPGETLESVAPWADQVRDEPAFEGWSPPLHFINTPDWQCAFTPATDCTNDRCLYGAILNYTARATKMTGEQQYEALKFLDHFLGDIHQPLHVAFASDYGGNSIKGTFFGESENLHHIWDYNILNTRITRDFSGDQDTYINYLVSQIKEWTSCNTPGSGGCITDWASDTAQLACNFAYKDENGNVIQDGFDLGEGYYENTIPIVEVQLAKGGLLLAGLLNNMWPN